MPTKKQLANLRPKTTLSKEEAKRIGSKGGIASVKARKERKTIKQGFLDLLSSLQADGVTTYQDSMLGALLRKAMAGDVKAAELILKAIGENGVEKVSVDADIKRSASDLFAALGALKK